MTKIVRYGLFEWHETKEKRNIKKHHIDFTTATAAFDDPSFIVQFDPRHSTEELRWFCIGKVESNVLTVRFTKRLNRIRIIGAGYWRKGRKIYEKENQKNKE